MFRLPWQSVWETLRSDPFYGDSTVVGQCLSESIVELGECVYFSIIREIISKVHPLTWDGEKSIGIELDRKSCGMKNLPRDIEYDLANQNKINPNQIINVDGDILTVKDAIFKYRTPSQFVKLLFLWNLTGLPVYIEGGTQPATLTEGRSPFPEFKRWVGLPTSLFYVDRDDLAQHLTSRNLPLPSILFPDAIGTQHFFDSVKDPNQIWKPILGLEGARQFLVSQNENSGARDALGDSPAHLAEVQDEPVVAATTTRLSPNKELELDREECREIARLIWSSVPEKPIDTVAQEIALGTHVVGQPCKWLDGRKSPSAVRKWIKDLCPAPRSGRPRKNP